MRPLQTTTLINAHLLLVISLYEVTEIQVGGP